MKRGKVEDKTMGPMFPRLHVNEIDKRGPRAPPRNKMALYEQLSVPSQRFTHTVPPQNSSSGTSDLVLSASQGGGSDKSMLFSGHLPPKHQFEKQYNQYSDLITSLTHVDKQKELDDEDFRVPIFIHSIKSMKYVKQTDDPSMERCSLSKSSCFSPSSKLQREKNQKEEKLKELVADQVEAITENTEVDKEKLDVSSYHERLKTDSGVQPQPCPESQPDSGFVEKENLFTMEERGPSPAKSGFRYETKSYEDEPCRSPRVVLFERDDSMSEATIADSVARLDVTPDDVVGVLGQKRFWKARRAIVNQQRVFSDQIFELHRLMKVQKSISTYSEVLAEDVTRITKPVKVSPEKKLPLDNSVKQPLPSFSKQKDWSEKPSHKEGSAENTVEKSTLTSHQNTTLPFHHKQSSNISLPLSITSSHSARPMCTNQSHGSQWLIPVMSPSEGLVYKPYPVPGFVGPAIGPWGAPGPTTLHHNFLTPAYGVPAPYPQYQFPSCPVAGPHPYFPAYGMPVVDTLSFSGSSIEQENQPFPSQFSLGNTPSQSNTGDPASVNLYASEEQVSTASNLNERTEHDEPGDAREERNKLQLFSKHQANPVHPPRVIKVVPHKPGSVTESVARIFRSIQEERKQHSSV